MARRNRRHLQRCPARTLCVLATAIVRCGLLALADRATELNHGATALASRHQTAQYEVYANLPTQATITNPNLTAIAIVEAITGETLMAELDAGKPVIRFLVRS